MENMESDIKEKILQMINAIEKKKLEIDEYISNLSIHTRNDMLKEISQHIISNNHLLQEILGTEEKIVINEKQETLSFDHLVNGYIGKIQQNPYKKVIFLREFLDLFKDRISEKDKDVILQSLKDEKDNEKLSEEMISLANIFKLDL
ncbi:MAG: hypothetical protein ACFFDY_02580 [Candidatus Thorarchaeota archaeon]